MPLRLRAAARGGGYLLRALALQRQLCGEVGARGGASLVEAANARFGHQGEGAIFGRYDQYLVPTIADHGYTFGRFSCACGGAAGTTCVPSPNATAPR